MTRPPRLPAQAPQGGHGVLGSTDLRLVLRSAERVLSRSRSDPLQARRKSRIRRWSRPPLPAPAGHGVELTARPGALCRRLLIGGAGLSTVLDDVPGRRADHSIRIPVSSPRSPGTSAEPADRHCFGAACRGAIQARVPDRSGAVGAAFGSAAVFRNRRSVRHCGPALDSTAWLAAAPGIHRRPAAGKPTAYAVVLQQLPVYPGRRISADTRIGSDSRGWRPPPGLAAHRTQSRGAGRFHLARAAKPQAGMEARPSAAISTFCSRRASACCFPR